MKMDRSLPVVLSELRKEKGLSQKEVAEELGVSQALLSHYEKGIRECGKDFLLRAADYYNVTCDYLLGRSSSKNGFGDYFRIDNTLPDDEKFSDFTLFRAALEICEKLAAANLGNGLDYSKYVSLELYRIMMNLAASGIIPKSWLADADSEYLGTLSLGIVNMTCSTIFTNLKSSQVDEAQPVPVCIKTVRAVSKDTLMRTLSQATPPFPDRYKK